MHKKSLLPSSWQVPKVFRDRIGGLPGRQRAMLEDGHLLIILHEPPGPDEEERRARFFWRKPDGSWASTTEGSGQVGLDTHLEDFETVLNRLDEQEEAARTANDYFKLMRHLNPLVRTSRNLHDALRKAREMVPDDKRIIDYRDRAYAIERQAELLANDAKNALDHAIALRSEEQAAAGKQMAIAGHRLNILAAFFFPIATLAALLGMNVKTGLEPETVNSLVPFEAVLIGGLAAGALLALFVTRKNWRL
ncbi:MAG: hypothetical protein JW829_14235 [Pirellulales bacterium]|nr:hypothetical protein [Pirellulales bacterium]